mmetsp:Transcript_58836/g.70796  ORF Transcript_58836/g.70796 Transcript_58836/m.70796 type:complete len:127 (-) Transcript_58836:616-996(-)
MFGLCVSYLHVLSANDETFFFQFDFVMGISPKKEQLKQSKDIYETSPKGNVYSSTAFLSISGPLALPLITTPFLSLCPSTVKIPLGIIAAHVIQTLPIPLNLKMPPFVTSPKPKLLISPCPLLSPI